MKKFAILFVSMVVLLMGTAWAEGIKELESRLNSAHGKDKIEVLSKIVAIKLKSDPGKAVEYGKEALKLLKMFKDRNVEIGVVDQVCQAYLFMGDYKNALEYGEIGRELAEKLGAKTKEARALNIIGIIYIQKGDYEKSRDYSLRAFKIFSGTGEKKLTAMTLNNIGMSYDMEGNYGKALEYYLKSLAIKEELGDKTLIASSYNNIGVIHKIMGNDRQALDFYLKALKIKEELNDQRGLASLYINIGNIYSDKKDTKKTLEYYNKSLEIDKKLDNRSGISSTMFNIGLIYFEAKNYRKALDYYNQSLVIREKMGEKVSIAQTMIEIGNVNMELGLFNEAIQTIEEGLAIAKEAGAQELIQQCYQSLSATYERMNDFRLALRYFKEYKNMAEKILGGESRKKIAEIQSKYETDKKEKEILLLKKDNEIQKYMLSRQAMIRNFMIAGFIVVLIVGVQLFRKYRYVFVFWKKKHYLGHYKILKQVAAGGMGTVYKAADITDSKQRTIAIKVLREEFFSDEVHKKRFKQEASIIDQLVHPNIVRVIERGESDGNLYIAMELLEGPTLAEIIQGEERLPIPVALSIMTQITDALKSIHEMDIIHRDLKPENIVLTHEGTNRYFVKLLDFGLATSQHMSRLTQTGMVIGTLSYLSPEQVAGEKITPASDVHALGVIFYEMLTGVRPFIGETTLDVMKQILEKEPIPPDKFRQEIERTLSDLVMFMIKKQSDHRPGADIILTVLNELSVHNPYSPE